MNAEHLGDVKSINYFGATISSEGSPTEEIKVIIKPATSTMARHKTNLEQ